MRKLKVGIAGFGVVGKRRKQFIDLHHNMTVVAVCDQYFKNKKDEIEGLKCFSNYLDLLNENLDILFVCLTNDVAAKVTINGLKKGFHVFCEKPPGRNVEDIIKVRKIESKFPNLKLKYGFNHRYHDSVNLALNTVKSGELGSIINIRGVYGKSRIISFQGGWRSQRKIAGGGILLDQGIHMLDLMRLFCGEFVEVKSFVKNSYWNHDIEDNAYAIMQDKLGRIAMIHSTATQWKHRFMMEISLTEGYIELHGILSGSKSYGEEKIIIGKRDDESMNGQMESKSISFLNDNSWKNEIFEFYDSIINDGKVKSGNSKDALETMKLVFKIYNNDENWKKNLK